MSHVIGNPHRPYTEVEALNGQFAYGCAVCGLTSSALSGDCPIAWDEPKENWAMINDPIRDVWLRPPMKCTIVYALEEPPEHYEKSMFLAGPTPRRHGVQSWRPEVIRLLILAGYDGVIFVPEDRSGIWHGDYDHQVEWEERYMAMADCILFWLPRQMDSMPGLTSNDEWGFWRNSGKAVIGAPPDAEHVRYQLWHAARLHVPQADSLAEVVQLALHKVRVGAERTGGEREVPLQIWLTESFQQWYQALKSVGNRLDHAQQVWTFRVGEERDIVFFWALHVDIYVAAEDRHKTNEVVLSRPDISAVVLYKRKEPLDDSLVVLIREFRSPAVNADVLELAGGSSFTPGVVPLARAVEEVQEETPLAIAPARFTVHEVRQVAATLSTHCAHLFSAEITEAELDLIRAGIGTAHGVAADTERTYTQLFTLREIRHANRVDWSMLGMIMQVLV